MKMLRYVKKIGGYVQKNKQKKIKFERTKSFKPSCTQHQNFFKVKQSLCSKKCFDA